MQRLTLVLVHVPRIKSLVVEERVDGGAHQPDGRDGLAGPSGTGGDAHHHERLSARSVRYTDPSEASEGVLL